MATTSLLLIDDDVNLQAVVARWLEKSGYHILTANDGIQGLRQFYAGHPALVILDINMPGMDGWTTAERLREVSDVPLIMLTARSHIDDRLRGFRLGIDDYLTKPFVPEELIARVGAILKRVQTAQQQDLQRAVTVIQRGDLQIDLATRRVLLRNQVLRLSPTEYRLLAALAAQPGVPQAPQTLLKAVWGDGAAQHEGDNLRTYIRYLREKIEDDPKHPAIILTEHGFGYCLA